MPIAGSEGNVGLHEFYWMLRDGAYDVVQPDTTTSEGLSQLRKVASTAELMGRQIIPHHGAGGIGLAAHLHLCATLRNPPGSNSSSTRPAARYAPISSLAGCWPSR